MRLRHMRLSVAVCAMLVLQSASAFAEDGAVPAATLNELGLGGMEILSDNDGMQIRGQSGSAFASGTSQVNVLLFNSSTGSIAFFGGATTAQAGAETAGGASSQATVNHATFGAAVLIPPGAIIIGGAGGSASASN